MPCEQISANQSIQILTSQEKNSTILFWNLELHCRRCRCRKQRNSLRACSSALLTQSVGREDEGDGPVLPERLQSLRSKCKSPPINPLCAGPY